MAKILPMIPLGVWMSRGTRNKGGRPAVLKPEHLEILRALAQEKPVCTLDEFRQRFAEESGVVVSGPTLRKGLQAAGIVRQRPRRAERTGLEASPQRRYGYTETRTGMRARRTAMPVV